MFVFNYSLILYYIKLQHSFFFILMLFLACKTFTDIFIDFFFIFVIIIMVFFFVVFLVGWLVFFFCYFYDSFS